MKQMNFKLVTLLVFIGFYTFSITSCIEDSGGLLPELQEDTKILDCSYFNDGENRTLVDDPDEAVDYIIDCQAFISVDVVIEPGVVIEFTSNAGLEIGAEGSLKAVGTTDEPIIFTGEDKIAGAWSGILFDSDDVKNELNYVTIEYAGGSAFNSNDNKAGLIMWAQTRIKVDNCNFTNSETYGVELDYGEANITSFTNNTFTDNNIPVYARAEYIDILDATSTYTGNTNDYVLIGCSSLLEGEHTWHNIDVPYRVEPRDFGITTSIGITENRNVIVSPGTTITFTSGTKIGVSGNGSLKAVGTANEMITFKGVDEVAGSWQGLEFAFTENINNKLDYVKLQHAGGGDDDAAVYCWADPKLGVTNSIFEDIDGCVFKDGTGFTFDNPNFSESGNTFTNTGNIFCP